MFTKGIKPDENTKYKDFNQDLSLIDPKKFYSIGCNYYVNTDIEETIFCDKKGVNFSNQRRH